MNRIERDFYLKQLIEKRDNGIYYIGLEDFCLGYIDELDSTL